LASAILCARKKKREKERELLRKVGGVRERDGRRHPIRHTLFDSTPGNPNNQTPLNQTTIYQPESQAARQKQNSPSARPPASETITKLPGNQATNNNNNNKKKQPAANQSNQCKFKQPGRQQQKKTTTARQQQKKNTNNSNNSKQPVFPRTS
jgi:hypothetical protein